MRDAPETLVKVIKAAADECYELDKRWRHGAKDRAPDMYQHIAAAVTAHALGDAVVEKAAAAACYDHEGDNAPFTFADDPVTEWWNCRPDHERAHYRAMARAAIAAALDGDQR